MKSLDVGQGRKAKLDDADYAAAAAFTWHSWEAGGRFWVARNRSLKVAENRGKIYLHLLVLKAKKGALVLFRNRDTLDFRRSNLVIADRQAAAARRNLPRDDFSSEYRGVSWNRTNEKWQVAIKQHDKLLWVGAFDDERQAARAYDERASELYGEFATLNFSK